MNRLMPLLLLCLPLFASVSRASDTAPRNDIPLDHLDRFLPLKSDRSILFIGDSAMPPRWEAIFRKASRGNPPEVRLDTGVARPLADCKLRGYDHPACLETLVRTAGSARIALLVLDLRWDTTMSTGWVMEPGIPMPNGKTGPPRQVFRAPTPIYYRSAKAVLIDLATRKLHYEGSLADAGETPAHATANLGKAIVVRLEKAFRPGVGTDFHRTVVSINPLAIAFVPGTFIAIQASYEKLLGTGKGSLAWDPAFLMYENEDRGLAYLFLPILGYRRYFRTEGRGAFFALKAGYLYQEDLGGISGMAISADDLMKTHFLALMLGPGFTIPIKRVRLQGGLALGMGFGLKQTWTADYWGEPENRSGYGFGMAPVVNLNLGLGWAF